MGWTIDVPKSGAGEGKKELPPVGTHLAVCVAVIDMGHQWQEPFKPEEKGYWQRRVFFLWELCDEVVAGTTKNHVIGTDLTISQDDRAKLVQWVSKRSGRPPVFPFDPTTELGQPCMLMVEAKAKPGAEKAYPKVTGMAALSKRDAASPPQPTYPLAAVSLDDFRAGSPVPEWVPYWYGSPLADWVKASREIGGAKPTPKKKADPAEGVKAGDPIPF